VVSRSRKATAAARLAASTPKITGTALSPWSRRPDPARRRRLLSRRAPPLHGLGAAVAVDERLEA
jgi:hypothetical protein